MGRYMEVMNTKLFRSLVKVILETLGRILSIWALSLQHTRHNLLTYANFSKQKTTLITTFTK